MLKPISLYFHVPFCTKKCPYCHFFVVLNKSENQEKYMRALELEWMRVLPHLSGYEVVSIYFGGGTPSLIGPEKIGTILSWIKTGGVNLSKSCEITLEANPEQITGPLMQEFKEKGINRVSIGVQSFSDTLLYRLGRTHSSNKSREAVLDTFHAGIDNISIDLMFELPTQTLTDWKQTLLAVKELPIKHLSLYNLVIEPNTPFDRKKKELTPLIPSQGDALAMFEIAVDILESIGLMRYEISAFAKEGFKSAHNMGYWTARPFFGLGPSAFSYINSERFSNVANLTFYCDRLNNGQSAIDFREKLPYPDNIKELLAVELRLTHGVDIEAFEKRHGLLPQDVLYTLKHLKKEGLLEEKDKALCLSKKGLLFYDTVASEII